MIKFQLKNVIRQDLQQTNKQTNIQQTNKQTNTAVSKKVVLQSGKSESHNVESNYG